jgi:predicted ATPase
MRKLDRIKLEGFKSIREMELDLRLLNVLIGANGAGKSNFISAFRLLNQIVERHLQSFVGKAGGADALLYFGHKSTDKINIELTFGDNAYKCILAPSTGDTLIFEEEVCLYKPEHFHQPFFENLGGGHRESRLEKHASQDVVSYILKIIRDWQVYHFHDTGDAARVKKTGDINDNEALRPDASNLAAFLYRLKERHSIHYRNIVQTIRLAAPFFDDFRLRPSPLSPDKILLEWKERDSDVHMNASALSDGTLRFMCLATLLMQPAELLPSTILIDEPELGLHPYAITLLSSMLKSAATKTQIIVSTQSVPLVNQFTPEDLLVVDREEGQSIFKRLNAKELSGWLEEYGLGDLWEKNVIGGRPSR